MKTNTFIYGIVLLPSGFEAPRDIHKWVPRQNPPHGNLITYNSIDVLNLNIITVLRNELSFNIHSMFLLNISLLGLFIRRGILS